MKILFWNIGYARQLDGSPKEWLQNGHQVFYHSKADQIKQLDDIIQVVKDASPDIFAYAEIMTGSFRNQQFNQQEYLAEKLSCITTDAESKYGRNILSVLPFHKGNTNGTCVLSHVSLQNIHLRSGGKTLVQKITIDDWVIFTVHLSLVFSIRKRQLQELAEYVRAVPETFNVVVCGDFNVLRGDEELANLLSSTGLTLSSELENTFPAHNPTLHLDHVLYRLKEVKSVQIKTLPAVISDHCPVLCTFLD
jgi:endonuclease/exonuclease/phosphatase family metal-dependent hydrolase